MFFRRFFQVFFPLKKSAFFFSFFPSNEKKKKKKLSLSLSLSAALTHVLLSSSLTSGAPGDTVARNFVPVSAWKQCRSKVEARRRTAPEAAAAEADDDDADVAPAEDPFSPPLPPLAALLPTGET